ncbi:MAG: beta-ketoacyl synthase N-terminal-like domain-containing protein [Methylacidiphilales bacterium]|nr:beta-ketoacyl synthase N-terminal-like domain-containing protein [Candidatus Methylacidiphilales bacterium]
MAKASKVLITGLGCITPLGNSLEETWTALQKPHLSKSTKVRSFDFNSRLYDRKALKVMDRRTRLALAAAFEAADVSGLDCSEASSRRGISLGIGFPDPGLEDISAALQDKPERSPAGRLLDNLNPLWLLNHLPNIPASHLAIQFKASGPSCTTSCGRQALQYAADVIAGGEADCMICGASDSSISPLYIACDSEMNSGCAASSPCEGAAILVLESESHAMRRNAKILVEIATETQDSAPGRLSELYLAYQEHAGNPLSAASSIFCALAIKALSQDRQLPGIPKFPLCWLEPAPLFHEFA